MEETSLRHLTLATHGVRLHAVEAGPEDGPLLILLHGFPEFWYGWRRQIGPLAAAGFRVLVPDQRGYNTSDKPRSVAAYGLDELALDVVGLIDATGVEKACVVGHDWGGVVGWWLGVRYPQRIERLALLNIPHPLGDAAGPAAQRRAAEEEPLHLRLPAPLAARARFRPRRLRLRREDPPRLQPPRRFQR